MNSKLATCANILKNLRQQSEQRVIVESITDIYDFNSMSASIDRTISQNFTDISSTSLFNYTNDEILTMSARKFLKEIFDGEKRELENDQKWRSTSIDANFGYRKKIKTGQLRKPYKKRLPYNISKRLPPSSKKRIYPRLSIKMKNFDPIQKPIVVEDLDMDDEHEEKEKSIEIKIIPAAGLLTPTIMIDDVVQEMAAHSPTVIIEDIPIFKPMATSVNGQPNGISTKLIHQKEKSSTTLGTDQKRLEHSSTISRDVTKSIVPVKKLVMKSNGKVKLEKSKPIHILSRPPPPKEKPATTLVSSSSIVDQDRLQTRKQLLDILISRAKHADDILMTNSEIKTVALDLEQNVYKIYCDAAYKRQCRHLYFNIENPSNNGFFRRLLNSQLSAKNAAKLTPQEMASKEYSDWTTSPEEKSLKALATVRKRKLENITLIKSKGNGNVNVLSDLFQGDTTSKHKEHLYDLNCRICMGKQKEEEPIKQLKKGRRVSSPIRHGSTLTYRPDWGEKLIKRDDGKMDIMIPVPSSCQKKDPLRLNMGQGK